MPRGRMQRLLDAIDIHLIYILGGTLLLYWPVVGIDLSGVVLVFCEILLGLLAQGVIWTRVGDLKHSGENYGLYLLANELLTLAFLLMLIALWATLY